MSENKTAIIFGGTGFIGSYLARELHKTGEFSRIISADLRPPALQRDGIEYVTCDVRQPIQISGVQPGAEIYDLAAIHTTPGHDDWEYFWTNLNGAAHINAFADLVQASRVTLLSSISTYGPTEAARDESGPMKPESAYGRSKLLAENFYRVCATHFPERKLVIVRPAVVFGPGERGNFTRLAAALKGRRFFYPGRRDTIKSCVYVGELVRSLLFMRSRSEKEITFNMAYPQRYTTEDICKVFADVAGYAKPPFTVPLPAMLAAGAGFEVVSALGLKTSINRARMLKLANSTNIVPKRLNELNYTFETDLHSGIVKWREESPNGEFI